MKFFEIFYFDRYMPEFFIFWSIYENFQKPISSIYRSKFWSVCIYQSLFFHEWLPNLSLIKKSWMFQLNIEIFLYLKHFAMYDKNIVHYIFQKHFAMFQKYRNRNVSRFFAFLKLFSIHSFWRFFKFKCKPTSSRMSKGVV